VAVTLTRSLALRRRLNDLTATLAGGAAPVKSAAALGRRRAATGRERAAGRSAHDNIPMSTARRRRHATPRRAEYKAIDSQCWRQAGSSLRRRRRRRRRPASQSLAAAGVRPFRLYARLTFQLKRRTALLHAPHPP